LILRVLSIKFCFKYQHIYVRDTNVDYNTGIAKNSTIPSPLLTFSQSWSGNVEFFALDSSHRQIKDYGGSLLSDLGK
jgi:hypothetical protein